MNIPVAIVDENGDIHRLVMNENFVSELTTKFREEGVTPIYTIGDNGKQKTYNAQAMLITAKGSKGKFMFIPDENEK